MLSREKQKRIEYIWRYGTTQKISKVEKISKKEAKEIIARYKKAYGDIQHEQ